MEREIRDTLDRIETREDVRVLYAVETGSRAWGFASTDSDWDVRLLYLRRPEWYLSIQRSCTGRHSPRPLGSGCCRPVTSPPGPACTTTRAWRRGTTASTCSAIRCASRNTSTSSARCWRAAGSRCTARRPRPSSPPWWRTSCPHGCVRSSRRCSHASAPATSWPRVPRSTSRVEPSVRESRTRKPPSVSTPRILTIE